MNTQPADMSFSDKQFSVRCCISWKYFDHEKSSFHAPSERQRLLSTIWYSTGFQFEHSEDVNYILSPC